MVLVSKASESALERVEVGEESLGESGNEDEGDVKWNWNFSASVDGVPLSPGKAEAETDMWMISVISPSGHRNCQR